MLTGILVALASAGIVGVGYSMLFGHSPKKGPIRSTDRFRFNRASADSKSAQSLRDDLLTK